MIDPYFITMKKKSSLFQRIAFNLVGCLLAYILLTGIVFKQEDYAWAITMLEENHDFVMDNGKMNLQERYTSKMGVTYSLFDSVCSRTPDTAIIYIPGQQAFFPKDQERIFTGEPFEKMWAIRFLYPRKVVTELEYERCVYSDEIDYVIVVNGKGVERLKYKVPYPIQFGVLYADSLQITQK